MHFDAPKHQRLKRRKIKPGYRKAAAAASKRALECRYGSQGVASSPVRKIDPVTSEVIAVLEQCSPTGP